jgi:large subunit ribosomal protein L21
MKFAIISTSGTQYRVSEGDTITVDHVVPPEKKDILFSDVLLVADGDNVVLGTPYIASAKVNATVIGHKKGHKIRVATFRSKSRSRRVYGHRSHLTDIKINKITNTKV